MGIPLRFRQQDRLLARHFISDVRSVFSGRRLEILFVPDALRPNRFFQELRCDGADALKSKERTHHQKTVSTNGWNETERHEGRHNFLGQGQTKGIHHSRQTRHMFEWVKKWSEKKDKE